MAFMAVLESDLRALSAEARRRYPDVKDAAEHEILKKLISHDAVVQSALKGILSTLKEHAEMADETVQLKTLHTILIILQSRLHPENVEI